VIHLLVQTAGLAVDEEVCMHALVRMAGMARGKKARDAVALEAAKRTIFPSMKF
jgi:hypothetical protein